VQRCTRSSAVPERSPHLMLAILHDGDHRSRA
jgi:hypothetical protein